MAPIVSKTVIARARKHLNTAMVETATILRTGQSYPCLVVIETRPIVIRGMPEHLRLRKWNIRMQAPQAPYSGGVDVVTGDRIRVVTQTGQTRGVFIVTDLTGPDTYNVSTTVLAFISNANVTFARDGSHSINSIDVFISRVTDEMKAQGISYDWEVWFDSSITYPVGTTGGLLVSKGDKMRWTRSPNPFPKAGAILDQPRYAYAEDAITAAYFKESL